MFLRSFEAPRPMPNLPIPSEMISPEFLDNWESECNSVRQYNSKLFEKSLRRMMQCAFWKGFFGLSTSEHFSWCPHGAWEDYWEDSSWLQYGEGNV